jgi:prepilin-type N-terminal cleavage/methylation domain-containing protein
VSTRGGRGAGFTLVEVLLAVLLLACGTVSAAYALGQVRQESDDALVAATARYLLEDGVAWVRSLPRLDVVSPLFGTEPGETSVDDVDDLDGLLEAPPRDRAGNAQSTDWQRRFVVDSVQIGDPTQIAADGTTPLMRVQITVTWKGATRGQEELLLARLP